MRKSITDLSSVTTVGLDLAKHDEFGLTWVERMHTGHAAPISVVWHAQNDLRGYQFGSANRYHRRIIGIVINSKKNEQISRLKVFQDLEIDYDIDLRKRRIDCYTDLFKHMVALAKYPEPEALSYEQIQKLALAFRDWYFNSGDLIASETTRDHYFDVQDGFKIILQKRSKNWYPDDAALRSASGLSLYLKRKESKPASAEVVAIAASEMIEGEYLPPAVNVHLRDLGSTLRTSMISVYHAPLLVTHEERRLLIDECNEADGQCRLDAGEEAR